MKRAAIAILLLLLLAMPVAQAASAVDTAARAQFSHSVSYGTYQVQAGDTLWRIAARYRTTISSLQALNNLSDSMIYVGQQLTVPTQVVIWSESGSPGSGTNPAPQNAYAQEVLRLTNIERTKAGLAPLAADQALAVVAQEKARDMNDNGYFSHTSPTYGSPFEMMQKYGITYSYAAENIAKGYQTPADVVAGWMGSSGHRANILNRNLTNLGVGVAGDVWVQMFRQP